MTELAKLGRLIIWLRYIESIKMWVDTYQMCLSQMDSIPQAHQAAAVDDLHKFKSMIGGCIIKMMTVPISDSRAADPNDFYNNFG